MANSITTQFDADDLVQEAYARIFQAIARGGTTLRDFLQPSGAPGYFVQELYVYGRAGRPCRNCGTALRAAAWGQRATVYCPRCQR